MMDHFLVQLYVEATVKQDDQLGKLDYCTMLWDGWTYVSNNLIYVLMLLHSMNKSEIIDNVNVSSEHHQSRFLVENHKKDSCPMPSEHECNQMCCHRQSNTHVEIQASLI